MVAKLHLKSSQVQLQVEATDWETAIEVASEPLLSDHYITSSYVEAMIDSVKKLGPYIVIAPGIALGHARPSSAVKQTGFAIATLEKSVKFGNEANDPVDVVIILASVDNTAHLSLLQAVAQFLNNKQHLQRLRDAQTEQDRSEVVELINGSVK